MLEKEKGKQRKIFKAIDETLMEIRTRGDQPPPIYVIRQVYIVTMGVVIFVEELIDIKSCGILGAVCRNTLPPRI